MRLLPPEKDDAIFSLVFLFSLSLFLSHTLYRLLVPSPRCCNAVINSSCIPRTKDKAWRSSSICRRCSSCWFIIIRCKSATETVALLTTPPAVSSAIQGDGAGPLPCSKAVLSSLALPPASVPSPPARGDCLPKPTSVNGHTGKKKMHTNGVKSKTNALHKRRRPKAYFLG